MGLYRPDERNTEVCINASVSSLLKIWCIWCWVGPLRVFVLGMGKGVCLYFAGLCGVLPYPHPPTSISP